MSQPAPRPPVIVVAGVLFEKNRGSTEGGTRLENRVLLTQRKAGTHLEHLWELPGGKVDPDEDPRDALVRELREELGIEVTVGDPIEITFFRYPTKSVLLLFYEVSLKPGSPEPRALDVADLRFVTKGELDALEFPPADVDVIAKLRRRL